MTTAGCWVVAFQVEQQTYAMPVEQIARIISMVAITPLPGVDPAVVGAINVQGRIVPVVDLRRHFQLSRRNWKRYTPILLTSRGTQTIGLIVDAVTNVINLTADQILSATEVLPADWPDMPLVQGIVRTSAGLWLLLDLNHLFQPEQVQLMLEASERLLRTPLEAAVWSGEVPK